MPDETFPGSDPSEGAVDPAALTQILNQAAALLGIDAAVLALVAQFTVTGSVITMSLGSAAFAVAVIAGAMAFMSASVPAGFTATPSTSQPLVSQPGQAQFKLTIDLSSRPGDVRGTLDGVPVQLSFEATAKPAPIHPTGTLLKGSGPKIYHIVDGAKLWIPSEEEFLALGFAWSAVKNVDDRYLSQIATAPQDGSLLKERSTPKVHLVLGGCGFAFSSEESFTNLGYKWADVRTVADGTLRRLRRCPRDGTLLKESDKAEVYIAWCSELRWVRSEERFNALGLDWNAIRAVPMGSIAAIPTGPAI